MYEAHLRSSRPWRSRGSPCRPPLAKGRRFTRILGLRRSFLYFLVVGYELNNLPLHVGFLINLVLQPRGSTRSLKLLLPPSVLTQPSAHLLKTISKRKKRQ
jgi:hypothetical protein